MSPTGRTLKLLRRGGWLVEVVERWVPGANIRRDLWGVGDVLAMKVGKPLLLVQVTSDSNVATRVAKSKAEPRLRTWLQCGCTFEVIGWAKRAGRWECRRVPLVLGDLDGVIACPPPRRQRKPAEPGLFDQRRAA
jgi:hypothetical protein